MKNQIYGYHFNIIYELNIRNVVYELYIRYVYKMRVELYIRYVYKKRVTNFETNLRIVVGY
jgi:hypothetical protein